MAAERPLDDRPFDAEPGEELRVTMGGRSCFWSIGLRL